MNMVMLAVQNTNQYFVSTEGSRVVAPAHVSRLYIMASVRADDGMELFRFESFLAYYDLDEPALVDIGRIVHEADIGDDLYDAQEAPGLDAVIRGISLVSADDDELLAMTRPMFDGLYELLRRSHLHQGPEG